MTVMLDKMKQLGPLHIMALSEHAVTAKLGKGMALVVGQKRPVAILIKQGKALTAFGPQGMPMTREQVETLCPGAWRTALEDR